MDKWQTFGHNGAKSILEGQLKTNMFAHAYLFSGPQGIGKKTLAFEFAKKVLVTEKPESHPDFHILDAGSEEIKMEQVLDFIPKLSFKPFLGGKKVAIINNAENLNQQSSNALLKTLEEPSSSIIIILIAGSGRLLPTIVSRCQVLNFSNFSPEQLKEFSESSKISVSDEVIGLSFGSIARLKQLAEDKDFLQSQKELLEKYQAIAKMPIAEKLLAITEYSDLENNQLENGLLTWLNWQTQDLANEPKNYTKVSALTESITGLKMNKNKKLVLQSLFLKI